MNGQELEQLKILLHEEQEKRKEILRLETINEVNDFIKIIINNYTSCFSPKFREINEKLQNYLNDPNVQKYIELTNNEIGKEIKADTKDVLRDILKTFKITSSNNIYVCTGSYATTLSTKTEESETFSIPFNRCYSCAITYREYVDIETGEKVRSKIYKEGDTITSNFEKNHLVLNPYSKSVDNNGLEEVKDDFFTITLTKNQSYAKKYILRKYSTLSNKKNYLI